MNNASANNQLSTKTQKVPLVRPFFCSDNKGSFDFNGALPKTTATTYGLWLKAESTAGTGKTGARKKGANTARTAMHC